MIGLQPATFEEFEAESRRGNVVPVVRAVLADLQTPVGAFLRVAGDAGHAFLLESVEGGERVARYSFLGAEPELVVRGRGDATVVERRGFRPEVYKGARAVDYLRGYFGSRKLARRAGLAPMAGGAVGYLAYDAARWFEPVLEKDLRPAEGRDDAVFMVFRTVLAFDRVRQQIEIASVVMTDEAGGDRARLRELYEAAVAETERIEKLLAAGEPRRAPRDGGGGRGEKEDGGDAGGGADSRFVSNWRREDFEAAVGRIKEHIAAGDCYQVVLSQRFSKRVTVDPLQIYRALRATNPSPYMFFLRTGTEAIVGASPEMLVRCRGQRLDYRPIAGTRRRGATETEDWLLGEEMRADEKEVAEHTMLVDLGRNDLGRVADYGSVEVGELMAVERYSHVQHLVTSLRARLRDDCDRFDALAACFPAGTVSGAPKVRAMQIISELEPDVRGVYAGAVLYADYADNLDSCIAIRTLVLRNSSAEAQAGAGIVADSVPEREYEETVNKARALLSAVELAERGL
ncbi:MAG: anthranilate synthase component I family protein [Acidobacteriota bacterium]|nr:anthranilate synthase component I family protein [Acidobacteriota bacterium]